MRTTTLAVWMIIATVAGAAWARETPGVRGRPSISSELRAVSVTELGSKGAALVGQAAESGRTEAAREVIHSVVDVQPTAITLVVGAVARAHPAQAATAAEVAVERLPKQTLPILVAAIQAAPEEVMAIVRAVSRKAPTQYQKIALAAVRLVAQADEQVLNGLAEGLPALAALIERSRLSHVAAGLPVRVPSAMVQVDHWLQAAARSMRTSTTDLLTNEQRRVGLHEFVVLTGGGGPTIEPPRPGDGLGDYSNWLPLLDDVITPPREYSKP